MSFISYAQNFEDVMLHRALKHIEKGFYIDVGANDPVIDSVTKAFYDAGWQGINIEPVSQWFEKLESQRPRDINLQLAIGAEKEELTFYEIADTGLSTLDKKIAERHEAERGYKKVTTKVPVNTLTKVCSEYHVATIHFLKIDVEGSEKKVLEGIDFSKVRPWIIVIESTLPNTQIEEYEEWESILIDGEYDFVYFDGLNRFYLAKEHQELETYFETPPNYFDGFKLAIYERHNQWLQNEWDAAKAKLAEMTNELASTQAQTEKMASQLQVNAASLSHSEVALAEKSEALANSEAALAKKREALTNSEAALTLQQRHSQWLQNEIDAANAKIDELNRSTHHWFTEADRLNHELHLVYNSKAWRITWPLRKFMQLLRQVRNHPIRFIHWIALLLKRSVRFFLIKIKNFLKKYPTLKFRVLTWIRKNPHLEVTLRRLTLSNSMSFTDPLLKMDEPKTNFKEDVTTSLPSEIANLTPSACRIYNELIAAIAERRKEIG